MDADQVANRYDNLAFALALVAFLMWLMFLLFDDAKAWLALGVVTTVSCATFRVLAAVRRLEVRLERVLPPAPTTPDPRP